MHPVRVWLWLNSADAAAGSAQAPAAATMASTMAPTAAEDDAALCIEAGDCDTGDCDAGDCAAGCGHEHDVHHADVVRGAPLPITHHPHVGSAGNHLRSETRLGRGSDDETHMCTGLGDGARTGLGLGGQRAHLIGIVV